MSAPNALLAQADLLLFLADTFKPPSPELQRRFHLEEGALDTLVESSGLSPEILPAVQAAGRSAATLDLTAWRVEHTRLFEGALACPINETAYVRRDKGAILADVAGFFRAFGIELAPEVREKVDHLVAELEFTAALLVLLARAREEGTGEAQDVTSGALRSFVEDHLGDWLPLFVGRLETVSACPVYVAGGKALGLVLDGLVGAHGLTISQDVETKALSEDDGTPYECGLAEADPPAEGTSTHPH